MPTAGKSKIPAVTGRGHINVAPYFFMSKKIPQGQALWDVFSTSMAERG